MNAPRLDSRRFRCGLSGLCILLLHLILIQRVAAQLPNPAEPLPPPLPDIGDVFTPAAAGITVIGPATPTPISTLHVVSLCRFPSIIPGVDPKGPGVFNGTSGWAITSPRTINDAIGLDLVQFNACLNFTPTPGVGGSPWKMWIIFGANPWDLDPPIAFGLDYTSLIHNSVPVPSPFPTAVWSFNVVLTDGADQVIDVIDPLLVSGFIVPPPTGPAPECAITNTGASDGKEFIEITVQSDIGLAAVAVNRNPKGADENANVEIPDFTPGTMDPQVARATKIDPDRRSTVLLTVYDMSGNFISCDPVFTRLTAEVPRGFLLEQNYPNPFNPSTTIRLEVGRITPVSLMVYDALGRRVATLIDEVLEPGTYAATWDGRNDAGSEMAGGLYVYRIEAGSFSDTKQMVLVR